MLMESFYLPSTHDTQDRTAEIEAMLQKTGACHLGPGAYYVANLTMPQGSTILGCGNATRVILPEGVEGFTIRLQTECTVKDFRLEGSPDKDIELQETVGSRHGLAWYGHYSVDLKDRPWRGTVEGLYIHGFSGGGITHNDTGYNIEAGLNVTNCYIWNCGAGINIAYWSEFSRYTNVHCCKNYYGLVNNGGNNMFVNCCFSGNVLGILMDNSDGHARNDSHANCVGCTIDHSDKNHGVGIRIVNMKNGYMFTACQVFFSQIELINCDGIVFDGLNCGRTVAIRVRGGGQITFDNGSFNPRPEISIEDNENVTFTNCFMRAGGVMEP